MSPETRAWDCTLDFTARTTMGWEAARNPLTFLLTLIITFSASLFANTSFISLYSQHPKTRKVTAFSSHIVSCEWWGRKLSEKRESSTTTNSINYTLSQHQFPNRAVSVPAVQLWAVRCPLSSVLRVSFLRGNFLSQPTASICPEEFFILCLAGQM